MKSITSEGELRQLHASGCGLIYNDFSRMAASGKDYNILHAAHCGWLLKSNITVPKVFFNDLNEAITWLQQNRGTEGINWKRCGTCRAVARPVSPGLPTPATALTTPVVAEQNAGPFREAEVERILVKHLRERGYQVRQQVPVRNGTVDVVANGPDGRWVIEVKGEDKGGYGSAEMNFQMGIGQIVSRMMEPGITYALAFPLTSHFQIVLRKYKASIGLRRLDLCFFVIHQNGQVDRYNATGLATFIDTLYSIYGFGLGGTH